MNKKSYSLFRALRRGLLKVVLYTAGLWLLTVLLLTIVPVPFSAVMAERQLSAFFSGNFHYRAHSDWVSMDQISPWMPLAVIAAEDQKFTEHWGFDLGAVKSVLAQPGDSRLRGASTLSQQTAKNVFLWDGRSWLRKGIEAGMTLGIEGVWRKKRILTVYLNVAEFGPGIFGVEAASQAYFHKSASQLSASQAALLAAVLPSPRHYQVKAPSLYVKNRQQWVLRQMQQLGGLDFVRRHKLVD